MTEIRKIVTLREAISFEQAGRAILLTRPMRPMSI
jgi:hypothetical protein